MTKRKKIMTGYMKVTAVLGYRKWLEQENKDSG